MHSNGACPACRFGHAAWDGKAHSRTLVYKEKVMQEEAGNPRETLLELTKRGRLTQQVSSLRLTQKQTNTNSSTYLSLQVLDLCILRHTKSLSFFHWTSRELHRLDSLSEFSSFFFNKSLSKNAPCPWQSLTAAWMPTWPGTYTVSGTKKYSMRVENF